MLSFKSLSEKKTKIKINPKKEDITEGSGDDVDLKKNHGDDCDCMKCESKRRKEDIDEAKVDKLVPDHKRSGKRLERYGNPHGSLALGGGIQRDRRADHAERRGKKTRGLKEVIQMTKKAYNKLHKDFKSDDPKKPRTTKYVPGKGTVSMPVKFVDEAKVDQGRSDYGKASIRNYRRKGPGHDDPGMFDPEGKRGKTIELRRAEHKARRGVKGAKVPAYKREEVEMEAYPMQEKRPNPYGKRAKLKMLIKSFSERERSRAGAVREEKKNCGCGQDPCITYGKNKNAHTMPDGTVMPGKTHKENYIPEEGYDHWRDKQLEKGTWKGGGGQPSIARQSRMKGKTVLQKEFEKKYGKGATALDAVKQDITKKHGKGAIMDTKKK